VFNTGNLLEELSDNLIGQDYPHLEWVVVDDGSTDETTLRILAELQNKCDFLVVQRQENSGAPCARNYGFSMATGEFVKFLDADDMLPENHLFMMAKAAESAELVVSPTQVFFDSPSGKKLITHKPIASSFLAHPLKETIKQFPFHHSGCLISRDLAARVAWDEELEAFQDLDFLWRILILNPTILIENNTWFINREHSYTERITTRRSPSKWESRLRATKKLLVAIRAKGLLDEYRKVLAYRLNTLILECHVEYPELSAQFLNEKKDLLGFDRDKDLLFRRVKYLVKKAIFRE